MRLFSCLLIALSAAFVTASCGNGKFSGDTDKTKTAKPGEENAVQKPLEGSATSSTEEERDDPPASLTAEVAAAELAKDGSLSPDDEKILSCLQEWGEIPVNADGLKGYRTLAATGTGFAGSEIKDVKTTDQPRLVLVKASSTGFSGADIQLMNPNGWYCIDISNVGFSATKLLLHCEAEQAGLQSVNEGFSSQQIDYVGC